MTTTQHPSPPPTAQAPQRHAELRTAELRTARAAGLWYLGLAITGMLGFLWLRPQLLDDDPATTLANLGEHRGLAGLLVVLELGIVITQAVAAVMFAKLFRPSRPIAAFALAAYGMVNSAAILASAGFLATANAVAADASLAPGGDAAATVALLQTLADNAWATGAVFFGLWLIPMGWFAVTTRRMPLALGWVLVAGGLGYLASALVGATWADAPAAVGEALTFPASVGEFWMIAYLLIKGIRKDQS